MTGILNRRQSIHMNCLLSLQHLPHFQKPKVLKRSQIWQRFREQDKIIGLRGRGICRQQPNQQPRVESCHPLLDETLSSLVSWSKRALQHDSVYTAQQPLFIKSTQILILLSGVKRVKVTYNSWRMKTFMYAQQGCMQFSKAYGAHGTLWLLRCCLYPLVLELRLGARVLHTRAAAGAVHKHFDLPQVGLPLEGDKQDSSTLLSLMCSLGNSSSGLLACPIRKTAGKLPKQLQTHMPTLGAAQSCCRQELTAAFHGDSKLSSHPHGQLAAFCLLTQTCIWLRLEVIGGFSVLQHCFTIFTLRSQTDL